MGIRAPWSSASDGKWSWTTFWLNIAAFITCLRFFCGESLSVGGFIWTPGEMDAALPTGILAALGGLYTYRRHQEKAKKALAVDAESNTQDV